MEDPSNPNLGPATKTSTTLATLVLTVAAEAGPTVRRTMGMRRRKREAAQVTRRFHSRRQKMNKGKPLEIIILTPKNMLSSMMRGGLIISQAGAPVVVTPEVPPRLTRGTGITIVRTVKTQMNSNLLII
jgi:hypothetical protein